MDFATVSASWSEGCIIRAFAKPIPSFSGTTGCFFGATVTQDLARRFPPRERAGELLGKAPGFIAAMKAGGMSFGLRLGSVGEDPPLSDIAVDWQLLAEGSTI
jgi:hypothetical protein